LGEQPGKDFRVGADESRLGTIASRKVLGSYDRHTISGLRPNQQYLAVIVSKIGALDNLGDERPKFERLVGRLVCS